MQRFETRALEAVGTLLNRSKVTVPSVHLLDEEANFLIIDDCGPLPTLKELLSDETLPLTLCTEIGDELGRFLASLHSSRNTELWQSVRDNVQAQTISAWATYGRLVSTLEGSDNLPNLVDPVLRVTQADLDAVGNAATTMQQAMTQADLGSIVHGDFWPGNILVQLSGEGDQRRLERLHIIDWELAKPGIPGLDIGQLYAELHLLRKFRPACSGAVEAIARQLQQAYTKLRGCEQIEKDMGATILRHVGAHLVAWGPRVEWGAKETVQEVVKEGVHLLVDRYEDSWLKDIVHH
jgi:aminoglycoside phosphotransferase (APT) family kinase protein